MKCGYETAPANCSGAAEPPPISLTGEPDQQVRNSCVARFRILFSEAARCGDSLPGASAFGSAAPEAAAHCGGARRNARNVPGGRPGSGASARAPNIPGSSTAQSSRANVASVCHPAKFCYSTVNTAGLCDDASSVSSRMYTITWGGVSEAPERRLGRFIASAVAWFPSECLVTAWLVRPRRSASAAGRRLSSARPPRLAASR
jgi:hypothetical protein